MKKALSKLLILTVMVALALPLLSCKAQQSEYKREAYLETVVIYRELISLPPGSTLTVTLENVSKMDVGAEIIASQTLEAKGNPPFEVTLPYDATRLDGYSRFAVRARIETNGKLLFTNTSHIDPFAGPAGYPVEIMVDRIP